MRAALLASCAFGFAQDQVRRPKIVLVLSGGGANSLMYFGALRWMEEHRIPVDGIAGNSGGALVGGWYATGIDLISDDELTKPPVPRGPQEIRLGIVSDVLDRLVALIGRDELRGAERP